MPSLSRLSAHEYKEYVERLSPVEIDEDEPSVAGGRGPKKKKDHVLEFRLADIDRHDRNIYWFKDPDEDGWRFYGKYKTAGQAMREYEKWNRGVKGLYTSPPEGAEFRLDGKIIK